MKNYFALSILLCPILASSCCLRGRDDQTLLLSSAVTDALPYTVSTITCYDSLVIQNHSYQNVFQLDILNVPDSTTSLILYNAEKGLLRMEKKDGRFWELL